MNNLKQSEDLKLKLIQLVTVKGMSIASAARELGLAPRTCQEFFSKEKNWQKVWWGNYEKELAQYGEYLGKRTSEFLESTIPAQYSHPLATEEDKEVYETYKRLMKNVHSGESNTRIFPELPQKVIVDTGLKIIVIADTQCKPEEDLDYMSWIGKFVNDKKPDVVVHIGDHFDTPSLSSYDKGKKSFEGRRLKADLEAGRKGLELFQAELDEDYNPRLVFCLGNHEQRIDRLANDMPELDGFVGTGLLPLKEMGWEVYDFLRPVNIGGIFFVHYLANPFSGKPYGGSALNQLKTVGNSFVVGHKQCLDVAIRPTLNGKHQIGIVNGACYPFDESYKGIQGNNHFRGLTVLHEVKDGFGTPMFVSLDYMKAKFYEEV